MASPGSVAAPHFDQLPDMKLTVFSKIMGVAFCAALAALVVRGQLNVNVNEPESPPSCCPLTSRARTEASILAMHPTWVSQTVWFSTDVRAAV